MYLKQKLYIYRVTAVLLTFLEGKLALRASNASLSLYLFFRAFTRLHVDFLTVFFIFLYYIILCTAMSLLFVVQTACKWITILVNNFAALCVHIC